MVNCEINMLCRYFHYMLPVRYVTVIVHRPYSRAVRLRYFLTTTNHRVSNAQNPVVPAHTPSSVNSNSQPAASERPSDIPFIKLISISGRIVCGANRRRKWSPVVERKTRWSINESKASSTKPPFSPQTNRRKQVRAYSSIKTRYHILALQKPSLRR